MSTPSTPRSVYRNRRINAMLQESQAQPTKVEQSDRSVRRNPRASRNLTIAMPRISRNILLIIAAVIAVLCAAGVFLLLWRGGSEVASRVPSQPVRAKAQAPASPPGSESMSQATTVSTAATSEPVTVAASAPEKIRFRLRRAAKPQAIGVLVLRLVNSNPRKGTCTLAIAAPNGRPMQKVLQADRAFEIALDEGQSIEVLVSDIGKSAVSGTITQPGT